MSSGSDSNAPGARALVIHDLLDSWRDHIRGSECLLDKDQTRLDFDPSYVFATTACHILLPDLVLFLSY